MEGCSDSSSYLSERERGEGGKRGRRVQKKRGGGEWEEKGGGEGGGCKG